VEIVFEAVETDAVRVLMDAGGGAQGNANQMVVNEIRPYRPVYQAVPVVVVYDYDARGALVRRRHFDQNWNLMRDEHFVYGATTQVEGYVQYNGEGELEAHFSYLFDPLRRRIAKMDLLGETGEWFANRDGDVAIDFKSDDGANFNVATTYLQGFRIDSKWARVSNQGAVSFYLVDDLSGLTYKIVAMPTAGTISAGSISKGET
jgi:hypothetical protein